MKINRNRYSHNFKSTIFIDFQYQSINCYWLSLIIIDRLRRSLQMYIQAEENGSTTNNAYGWSFGDGGENNPHYGWPCPSSGRILCGSISATAGNNTPGEMKVAIVVNGAETTILDRIKWEIEAPLPPIQWCIRATTKARHFFHHWNGGRGGLNFSSILSKIVDPLT